MLCIKSYLFIGVLTVSVRCIALALLIQISMPPNLLAASSTAASTCSSYLISQTIGSAVPPTSSISSAAVKIVPGRVGCDSVVFAKIAIFAQSFPSAFAI